MKFALSSNTKHMLKITKYEIRDPSGNQVEKDMECILPKISSQRHKYFSIE